MLKIIPRNQIKARVEGSIPGDIDAEIKFDFVATWDVLTSSQQEQIFKGDRETRQLFATHLKNVEGVQDENGNEMPFSHELVDTLYEIIPVRNAMIRSFHSCQTVEGREAVKAKN